jgi:hypothetical protein
MDRQAFPAKEWNIFLMGLSDEDDPVIEEVLPAFSMLASHMYSGVFHYDSFCSHISTLNLATSVDEKIDYL